MRKLLCMLFVALGAVFAFPALAADIPEYHVKIPNVDYGLGDSFYLRGSSALNLHWAHQVDHPDACTCGPYDVDSIGYGYSWGVGFGYETGTGLRFDATIDTLETTHLGITKTDAGPFLNGKYTMMLRSTLGMANAYYDFNLGGGFGQSGGTFAYVGGGLGLAWNHTEVNAPTGVLVPSGNNVSPAAAIMAGVGYDMDTWVVDAGYRGIWISQVNNSPTSDPDMYYTIDNNLIHEVRGTVRYRFN